MSVCVCMYVRVPRFVDQLFAHDKRYETIYEVALHREERQEKNHGDGGHIALKMKCRVAVDV